MTPYAFAALVSAEKPLTPENVRPGGLAFLVVMVLCVAVFFLARSFLKHSKKAQEPWEGEGPSDKSL
ncbi:MAG: hypothetical protein JWR83_1267 [Aeromicrobium sp.]|nr:hypothetical protein [Aeromicrobium sp.]